MKDGQGKKCRCLTLMLIVHLLNLLRGKLQPHTRPASPIRATTPSFLGCEPFDAEAPSSRATPHSSDFLFLILVHFDQISMCLGPCIFWQEESELTFVLPLVLTWNSLANCDSQGALFPAHAKAPQLKASTSTSTSEGSPHELLRAILWGHHP